VLGYGVPVSGELCHRLRCGLGGDEMTKRKEIGVVNMTRDICAVAMFVLLVLLAARGVCAIVDDMRWEKERLACVPGTTIICGEWEGEPFCTETNTRTWRVVK